MKEGLQRPRDVLLSGPFKKFQNEISSTLRYGFFRSNAPEQNLGGADQRHTGCRSKLES
ncbi:hypothetical protein SBA5_300019 [Candidatus Sulfotelmatomonas gaucii]|uniref:Uncharacterized protein n=1 Tax=Candidatus Sulfuritelmatomonas gaucii TaxID=2043161 RepID=A0A2N9LED0_9BACT|nr:hypothetical protein SBA5_300019 [Candidatus Sulfotelmatomonas gaucii]